MYIETERLAPFKNRGVEVDVVLDLMIHDLDLVVALARSEVKRLSASGFRVLTRDIDIATAHIEFASGCVAKLSASRVSQAAVRKLRMFQRGLYLSADLQSGAARYITQSGGEVKQAEENYAGGDALADAGTQFCCFHSEEASCRGERRGRPPRAQARARRRAPGARAPEEVRMNPIQMVNPAAEYRLMQAELDAAVLGVLRSGRYILGPEGEALEKELAAYLGAAHAVGCNSGTDALHLPLVAAGIGPGDEVIVPAFTFFATAEAVSYTGATPVFADIDPGTFNLDPKSLHRFYLREDEGGHRGASFRPVRSARPDREDLQ